MVSSALRYVSLQTITGPDPAADVLLVHDGSGMEELVLPALRPTYTVSTANLWDAAAAIGDRTLAVVFCVDLASHATVREIRNRFIDGTIQAPRVFVLPGSDRRSVVQAYSAGAHQLLVAP